MRIARLVTVCAALISTVLGAETVHSKRRPQSKDHLPQPKPENGTTDLHEMTFTATQSKMTPPVGQPDTSGVYVGASNRYPKSRPSRSPPRRARGQNRFKGNRRRRQLQHSSSKPSQVGRSFDFSENHVESQQLETVQGPAEAFDEGTVRLEPIYRVSKNKNVFDSILDAVHHIVDPPKSVGPLVGPFNFPGIGDKVYVRLLEPVRPNNLVIRLVSHLPASEVELALDKDTVPSSELIEQHADVPVIDHESVVLSSKELTDSYDHLGDVHLASSDNLLSSSDHSVHQVAKTSTATDQKTRYASSYPKGVGPRAHKLNLKPGDTNGGARIVRHRKRQPALPSTATPTVINDYADSFPRSMPIDPTNKTEDGEHLRGNDFQDAKYEQVYPFHPPINESGNQAFQLFETPSIVDLHRLNATAVVPLVYSDPTVQFDFSKYPSPQMVPNFQAPNVQQPALENNKSYDKSSGDDRKYSIKYTSKRMRYLNLDGSVETAIKPEDAAKRVELGPIYANTFGPLVRDWKSLRRRNVRTEKATEPSTRRKYRVNLQKRNDGNVDAFLEVRRKLIDDGLQRSRDTAINETITNMGKRESRRCSGKEEGECNGRSVKLIFDQQQHEASENNAAKRSVLRKRSTGNPMLQTLRLHGLQSFWRNAMKPKKV